ncbi:unnamed protein product [Polarella glacialis]|uniref:ATP-grasp domain-containing protein n=1 Tax=Polarella glacialis TaxID=89957 RepID=A0A813D8M3_POLGL|nr:unnamed protein product [Polarella glacialis]
MSPRARWLRFIPPPPFRFPPSTCSCDSEEAKRPKGVVLVTKEPIRSSRELLLRLHAAGLRHAVEARRSSSSAGSCLQDRRLHEFVEDVLNAEGRALKAETAFTFRCVDVLGPPGSPGVKEAASRIDALMADVALLGAIPAAFEDLAPLADQLSEALDLPLFRNDPSTSSCRVDKFEMQRALSTHCGLGARQVLAGTAEEAVAMVKDSGLAYPVIAKPVNSGASDGLFLCRDEAELGLALRSNIGRQGVFQQKKEVMVVQEYFEGDQYVVNTVSLRGAHRILDMWRAEKVVEGSEIFYGHQVLETDLAAQADIVQFTSQVLDATGLSGGAAHVELVRTDKGVRLIEINPRTAGHSPRATQFVGGEDQLSALASALVDPDAFFREATEQEHYRGSPLHDDSTVMAVFLRARQESEVSREELLRIISLPTFRCFDRVETPIFEEAVLTAPNGAFWLAARTEDLFTVPLTVLCSGPPEQLRRDLEDIRELEREALYRPFGTFEPSLCAGMLTGGSFSAWESAILAQRRAARALAPAAPKNPLVALVSGIPNVVHVQITSCVPVPEHSGAAPVVPAFAAKLKLKLRIRSRSDQSKSEYSRHLQTHLADQGLLNTGKLNELRNVHVGVDAVFWLRSIQALKDPFADALGGIPPGIFGFVDKELDAFKEYGITPLFVFQGVAPGPQHSMFVSRMDHQMDMAWTYLAQGEKSAAQKCFAVSTSRINGDFVYFIFHHLRNRGYECLQAPYFAGAQLAHFAEQGVIQTIFGPPGLLLYGVKSVVIHLNFPHQSFDWVDLDSVLTKWQLSWDEFVDACMLAGTEYCLTYPYLNLNHFQPTANQGRFNFDAAVYIMKQAPLINWMQTFPTEEMKNDHVDGYCICKVLVQNSPVLHLQDHAIRPLGACKPGSTPPPVPCDFASIMGQKLPPSLYYLMLHGVISHKLPQALAKGEWTDKSQPLVDTAEFRSLLADLQDYRQTALGLIAVHLHRGFQNKAILCKAFWENASIRQALGSETNLPAEARLIYPSIQKGLRWNISKEAVLAEMNRQKVDKVDFKFCLTWHAREFENDGPLMQGITDNGPPSSSNDLNALAALVHFTVSPGQVEEVEVEVDLDAGEQGFAEVLGEEPPDWEAPEGPEDEEVLALGAQAKLANAKVSAAREAAKAAAEEKASDAINIRSADCVFPVLRWCGSRAFPPPLALHMIFYKLQNGGNPKCGQQNTCAPDEHIAFASDCLGSGQAPGKAIDMDEDDEDDFFGDSWGGGAKGNGGSAGGDSSPSQTQQVFVTAQLNARTNQKPCGPISVTLHVSEHIGNSSSEWIAWTCSIRAASQGGVMLSKFAGPEVSVILMHSFRSDTLYRQKQNEFGGRAHMVERNPTRETTTKRPVAQPATSASSKELGCSSAPGPPKGKKQVLAWASDLDSMAHVSSLLRDPLPFPRDSSVEVSGDCPPRQDDFFGDLGMAPEYKAPRILDPVKEANIVARVTVKGFSVSDMLEDDGEFSVAVLPGLVLNFAVLGGFTFMGRMNLNRTTTKLGLISTWHAQEKNVLKCGGIARRQLNRHRMGHLLDISVGLLAVSVPALVAFGMFGRSPREVSVMFPDAQNPRFGWHPVLMSARLSFSTGLGLELLQVIATAKSEQNRAQAMHMVSSAHLPNRMFFGYDFKKQEWKPMIKVAHSWVGYALLVGVLAQGYMGAMKLKLLKATGFGSRLRAIMGSRSMGKLCFMESYTILGNVMWLWLCVLNILIAITFWSWTGTMKVVLLALTLFCCVPAISWPREVDKPLAEATSTV